MDLRLF